MIGTFPHSPIATESEMSAKPAAPKEMTFPQLLRFFRERVNRSRNNLAYEVGVDRSYLTRIEHGDREPTRAHIVEALSRCLRLSNMEKAHLLALAGYWPWPDLWSDLMPKLADVLQEPDSDTSVEIAIGVLSLSSVAAVTPNA